jgi:hypothetical protein
MALRTHQKLFSRSKTFLQFKWPESFKKIFKNGENVEDLQAYRLIPRTPPFPGRFIVPLNVYKFGLSYFDIAEKETQGYSTILKNYPASLGEKKVMMRTIFYVLLFFSTSNSRRKIGLKN